jgi:putative hemolysin
MIFEICILIILVLINGVFSASEIAFLSIDSYYLEERVEKGNKKAFRIKKMLEEPSGFLATIQIVITLAGFLASAFAADTFAEYFSSIININGISKETIESATLIIVTLILSYFTLVFGELVPKRIGMNYPNKLSFLLVNTMTFLTKLFYPLVWLLTVSTNLVCKVLRVKKKEEHSLSEAELRKLIIDAKEDGAIKPTEQKMIMKVFNFNDIKISKVMKRLNEVVMLNSDIDFEEALEVVKKQEYTRYPVYDSKDNKILGLLNAKDILIKDNDDLPVSDYIREILFIDEDEVIDKVFRKMKREAIFMAMVTKDEKVIGMATMEDIIEEILGEIEDEYD